MGGKAEGEYTSGGTIGTEYGINYVHIELADLVHKEGWYIVLEYISTSIYLQLYNSIW